jgi:type VI secretion system secreted protein VgrG
MNIDIMSAGHIQAERIIRVETSLGADVVLPESVEVREKIGGLFEISVAVRSKKTDLKAQDLVGTLMDVSLETGQGTRRTWNGLIVEMVEGPAVTRGLRAYHLVVMAQHWLLTQRSNCRIWLDKTSVEVAQVLMGEHGLKAPVTKGIVNDPAPQHYSVQFNETDFAYLTRRLEEDGIFHWFAHDGGAMGSVAATHTLHIASDISGYTTGPETDIRFAMGSTDRNHISKFEKRFRFVPGKRSAADWNFLTPGGPAEGNTPSLVKLPKNEAYELYEYPSVGGYGTESASESIDNKRVEQQSRLRMQAAEVDHEKIEGLSNVRTLSPARRFKPYDVANPSNLFEEHIILEIVHTARDRSYETNAGDPEYNNAFTAIPSRVPATPHRTTPRPRIDGTQIALVAGPEGEEIHPDEYGRIKLWFPWDRYAKKDGSDTCWVRVTQNWAGAGWGGQIIPRIGMEVMVMYLDGDPDRPVVTGVVPNPKQKVPYALPENKTKSVFRTNTHQSKNKKMMNEITFDDKERAEEIFIHGQKDMSVHIEHNESKIVDNNAYIRQRNNLMNETGNNRVDLVRGDYNITVGVHYLSDGSRQKFRVLNDLRPFANKLGEFETSFQGSGNYNLNVDNNKSESIQNSSSEMVGGTKSLNAGNDLEIMVGRNHNLDVNDSSLEEINSVKRITVGEKFEIICGASKFTMDKNGNILIFSESTNIISSKTVTINGKKINLN